MLEKLLQFLENNDDDLPALSLADFSLVITRLVGKVEAWLDDEQLLEAALEAAQAGIDKYPKVGINHD